MPGLSINAFNGVNYNDQADTLIGRSHQPTQGGSFSQVAPTESPDLENMDFDPAGIRKRLGSATLSNIASLLPAGDSPLRMHEWVAPGTSTRIQVLATVKTILSDAGGSFQQLNASAGSAFTWNADVARVSFVEQAGHLFILPDGVNKIQAYRSGTSLQDQANHKQSASGSATYTLSSTSTSGQNILRLGARGSSRLSKWDRIVVGTNASTSADTRFIVSFTGSDAVLDSNLSLTHTANEVVQIVNRFIEPFGGATQFYNGEWGTGYYKGMAWQGRFLYGNGDSILEYSDVNEPWDSVGGGFWQAKANIVACTPFIQRYGNNLISHGFIFTDAQNAPVQILSGFDISDAPNELQGARVPINYRCVVSSQDWLIYLTEDRGIEALNLFSVIDLGRRLKAADGMTTALDTMNLNTARSNAFGWWNPDRKQVQFFDGSGNAFVLDFQRGEPVVGHSKEQFEQYVRCLPWNIYQPSTNAWFVDCIRAGGISKGLTAAGVLYTIDSGTNDLGNIPILEYWDTPEINCGLPVQSKNWGRLALRTLPRGAWDLEVYTFLDRDGSSVGTPWTFEQVGPGGVYGTAQYDTAVYGGTGVVRGRNYTDLYSEVIRFRLQNQGTGQDWQLSNLDLEWRIGGRHD